ncbi:hypothetical protein ACIRQQ_47555 [Streptomyces fuscichromogenes]|uniref:hypothetical protein n=1 Tax=Streptomyces fuscichromogenes TaxID=1324013 RepID=UPI003827A2BF
MAAAALRLTVSAGFPAYAATPSAHSRLYGSRAGVVVFLARLWLSALALLAAAQFAAELGPRAQRTGKAPVP